jgi:hypothetical protein
MKVSMAATLVAIAVLSGCATKVDKGVPSSSASATAPRAPSQPITVPAASAKKVVLAMSGPKNVVEARDWAGFKEEWRATFADHAKSAGITFSMQADGAKPTPADGTLLTVFINDYRMVGIGSRIFLGVMTGNAYIDAKVQFSNLNSGESFGTQTYNTTSSAWEGVFGKMTPQQVDAIAAEVFGEIKNH